MATSIRYQLLLLSLGISILISIPRSWSSTAPILLEDGSKVILEGSVSNQSPSRYFFSFNVSNIINNISSIRITTTSFDADSQYPVQVLVRQYRHVSSWQLPLMIQKQATHTVSKTLCPFDQRKFNQFVVEFFTYSSNISNYELVVEMIGDFYLSFLSENFLATPSAPVVFGYRIPNEDQNVMLKFSSKTTTCAVVSIQKAECPYFDEISNIRYSGRYQTMLTSSGLTLKPSDFGPRVVVIMAVYPNNNECIDNPPAIPSTSPPGSKILFEEISKNITVTMEYLIPAKSYWIPILAIIGIFTVVYALTLPMIYYWKQLYKNAVVIVQLQELNRASKAVSQQNNNKDVFDSPIIYVSDLSKKVDEKNVARRYFWYLIIIGIFYAVPVFQLVMTYQRFVAQPGNDGLCYYNFLCSYRLGIFMAFNNFISNIGYVLLGILLIIVTLAKKAIFNRATKRCNDYGMTYYKEYGVPQRFGVFIAIGVSLIMEGILSACYHICPNKTNFQFDTSYMYITAILIMVQIHNVRHPDLIVSEHMIFLCFAVIICLAVIGVLFKSFTLWVVFTVIYIVTISFISVLVYYYGQWRKFSWKGFFSFTRKGCFSSVRSRDLLAFLLLVNALNWGLALFGLIREPDNFGSFFLAIFMSNLMMYLAYYIAEKIYHKEKILWLSILLSIIATVLWVFSIYFFRQNVAKRQATPARSRELNRECAFLDFYDYHDIWHMLSAGALFVSFLLLLSLDDDLVTIRRDEIIVF
ncbi:SID1 transmembrane family member 1 [Trichoplax sp. H2]|nr:SID1 transmembrane family member 1 [Trichoplax sp. H2]|eukprot:RDD43304.1 SID1 transmembrane family member 1 [Trichoplax sp. H2]